MKKRHLLFAAFAMFAAAPLAAQANSATIDQENADNSASLRQFNDAATSPVVGEILQTGADNQVTILQIHHSEAGGRLYATTVQEGDGNVALQEQGSHEVDGVEMGGTSAIIHQGGDGNEATQTQLRRGNLARIQQAGSGNVATQEQDLGLESAAPGSFNTAILEQFGDQNTGTQTQNGHDNWASAFQFGHGNEVEQEQNGYANEAVVEQGASNGLAYQLQLAPPVFADDNFPTNQARIEQFGGTGNQAGQWQVGTANNSEIFQTGSGHWASTLQEGSHNLTTLTQQGSGNFAAVRQISSLVITP